MNVSTFFIVYFLGLGGSIIFVTFFFLFRHRGRILIRIKAPTGEQTSWRKPNRDGTSVTMYKGGKRKPKWIFKFTKDAIYFSAKTLGLRRVQTLDIFPEAKKAIEYNYKTEEVTQPQYTKEEENKWIHSSGLDKFTEGIKTKTDLLTIIIIFLIVVNCGMTFLLLQGRL